MSTEGPSTTSETDVSTSQPDASQPDARADERGTTGKPKGSILQDRSFWGLAITQFLGAFNDNLYKQLILLIAIPAAGAAVGEDMQGYATALFSLPFVLFSGFAGYLADRFSKSKIIVLCKLAEIVITLLAVVAFLWYSSLGDIGTWTVLFWMGVHSTLFGPSKYGILPELFRDDELPRANGLILMSTFLAIILGVVAAGGLKDVLVVVRPDKSLDFSNLWIGSLVCTGVAVIGTATSFLIRSTPPAQQAAKLSAKDFGISKEMRELLTKDRPLLLSILVSSMFYVIAGVVMPTVNILGKNQLKVALDLNTSILTGGLAIGIILGAVSANLVMRGLRPRSQVFLGTVGMLVSLIAIGAWQPGGQHLLGYWGALLGLIATGMFAAVFIIPIQVFMQKRPPSVLKGRMIGTMNLANFIGVLIAGPLYQIFLAITTAIGWPVSSIFWMLAILLLPIVWWYRLPAEA
ncbi:MFS transporter [Pirellulaceae bacterium SH467]